MVPVEAAMRQLSQFENLFKNAGGVDNIPFGNMRAKTVRMRSIFWLSDFNNTDVSPLP